MWKWEGERDALSVDDRLRGEFCIRERGRGGNTFPANPDSRVNGSSQQTDFRAGEVGLAYTQSVS